MDYCDTSNRRMVGYRSRFPNDIVGGEGCLTERIGLAVKALFTPETSGPVQFHAGFTQIRWWGSIKTLFWIMNAIIIGILIANFCN